MINFTKMHGLGNDFVVMNNLDGDVCLSVEEIRQLSDRRFGIGFDQLLMIETATSKEADFRYVIFNADGSEVSQCGNGARCFALYIQKKSLSYKNPLTVETNSGLLVLNINNDDTVKVDMGTPNFEPTKIPLNLIQVSPEYNVEGFMVGSLSIGNPHAILIQDEIANIDYIASKVQSSELFPEGVNVGFMKVLSKSEIQLRVVERGVGETLACGSGACAVLVAAVLRGLTERKAEVVLDGGPLLIEWRDNNRVSMTGPTEISFNGSFSI